VLSGTGSDGMRGVRDIKASGGVVLVQDETSARFDGMPRAAISTGLVDAILRPEEMPDYLGQLHRHALARPLDPSDDLVADAYPRILDFLRRQTGIDFTFYKAASVLRRIERRMGVRDVDTLVDYARLLSEVPGEVTTLFKDLLIGVTRFFRDPEAFELLRTQVLPAILENARWDEQVRVWVAGCSTGEEAYSLGILFLEAMEATGRRVNVKIFATDIDRDALEFASAGQYPESIVVDLSPERLDRWFVRRGERYVVGRELRSMVLFAAHNLVRDPPFTRMDLITCRNLLIYLEPVLQRKVFSLFHYALRQGRFMLIGPSETVGDASDQFRVVESRWKLFQRQGGPRTVLGETLDVGAPLERRRARSVAAAAEVQTHPDDAAQEATKFLLGAYAPAAVLVSAELELQHVFGDAQRFLSVPVGRASLNIVDMLSQPMAGAVSTAVHQAHHQCREVRYVGLAAPTAAGLVTIDLRVVPVQTRGDRAQVLVMFEDQRPERAQTSDVLPIDATTEQRLRDLQGELAFTKENLQATIEELETSNEELQSTNEELLSANEELQSTNEELQSVNEELYTVNQEYQAKVQELSELNGDLDNLLRSTEIGTLFLDEDLHIRRFTPALAPLINMIPQDVGRSLEHFAFKFQAPGLIDALRSTLRTSEPHERMATLADGRRYMVRVHPYIADAERGRGVVVSFIDVTATLREQERLQVIIDSLPHEVAVLDAHGRIALVNRAWRGFATDNGADGDPTVGLGADYLSITAATMGAEREVALAVVEGLRGVLRGERPRFSIEYPCHSPTEERWFELVAVALAEPFDGLVVSHIDVTRRRKAERQDGGALP
jgi:two-component system CheB/CheR fusion protein